MMTGTLPSFGAGNLSFSVNRHGTVSTSSPLCASAILARQQNGLNRRSASAPHKSNIVIAMARSPVRCRRDCVVAALLAMTTQKGCHCERSEAISLTRGLHDRDGAGGEGAEDYD